MEALYGRNAEITVCYMLMTGMANCDVYDWAGTYLLRPERLPSDWAFPNRGGGRGGILSLRVRESQPIQVAEAFSLKLAKATSEGFEGEEKAVTEEMYGFLPIPFLRALRFSEN